MSDQNRVVMQITDAMNQLSRRIRRLEIVEHGSGSGSVDEFIDLTDVPAAYTGEAGKILAVNGTETGLEFIAAGGGVDEFIELTDVPAAYTGEGGKFVAVNVGETGLEFVTGGGGVDEFIELTDVPAAYTGEAGKVVAVNGAETGLEFIAPGGGVDEFIELTDVPAAYTGEANKLVAVNAGETALEFISPPAVYDEFTDLTDTPAAYTGQSGKAVAVNVGETALEFVDFPAGVDNFLDLTDTPAAYTGQSGKLVAVNVGETALEFVDIPTPSLALDDLTDVDAAAPDDGQVLAWDDGTSSWIAADAVYAANVGLYTTIGTFEGTLTAGSFSLRFHNLFGVTRTITRVYLSVATAPTGQAIIVDVHKNGTTIFTNQANRPQIAAGANTGDTTTIDVPGWLNENYLTFEVDQVGSLVPGAYLTVHVVHDGPDPSGGGVLALLDLTDTPAAYTANRFVAVNSAATGIEFTESLSCDLRLSGGLYVGSIATDPDSGTLNALNTAVATPTIVGRTDSDTDEAIVLRLDKRVAAGTGQKRWDFLIDDNTGIMRVRPTDSNQPFEVTSGGGLVRLYIDTSSGDARVAGGLYVGSVATDPASGEIISTSDIKTDGGLYLGDSTSNPAAGDLMATGDARLTGGLYVGSVATDPASGTLNALNTDVANPTLSSRTDSDTDEAILLRLDKRVAAGTGQKRWDFLIDDNTGILRIQPIDSNQPFEITNGADAVLSYFDIANGDFRQLGGVYVGAVDTDPAAGSLTVEANDAATNTSFRCLILKHNSSNTPTTSFGVQLHFQAESDSTEDRDLATITASWANATDASRRGRLLLYARDATTQREGMRIESDGSEPMIGFYGSGAVKLQTITGSKASVTAMSNLLTALQSLGLIIDSTT